MSKTASLLQRFFDASLIPADTGDERLDHYQSAADGLAARFLQVPQEAVAAGRVAVDPHCPATDPWFETVQIAVKEHWRTFLSNHHDAARLVSRGILLDALRQVAAKNEILACAIWYGGSSLLNHHGDGPEQAIIRDVYAQFGESCEEQASRAWRISGETSPKAPGTKVKLQPPKLVEVDQTALEHGLSDAAGPNDRQGQNHGNPNPYWTNAQSNWSFEFAPRAAMTIATEVNKVLKAATAGLKAVSEQIDGGLSKFAIDLARIASDSVRRSERLTGLVWWKNALYSPALERSYRGLDPVETALVLTSDLARLSDAPVPLSVEYFMRETLQALVPSCPHVTLVEFLAAAKASSLVAGCLPTVPAVAIRRVSLLELVALARQSDVAEDSLPARVGIGSSIPLPLTEWAVWLLRENLAAKLMAEQGEE